MAIKCKSCDGIYDATHPDGTPYFHACPPVRKLRVQEADGSYSTVDPGAQGARRVVGEKFVERNQKRDENPRLDPATGKTAPIAEGRGVVDVDDNLKA